MSQEKPVILAVDDEPFNLDLLEQELMDDYRVVIARDGAAALETVDACSPDVVLLDVAMPGMDGLEVLRRLRRSDRHITTPVILLTAHTALDDRVRGLDAGADDYVTKPFESEELHARIRSALRVGRLQKALTLERNELRQTLIELSAKEAQLVHAEKMASLGKLVAGIAHELNNPVGSIYANMDNITRYMEELKNSCRRALVDDEDGVRAARIFELLDRLVGSCAHGADRVRRIVTGLRNFSRLDEAEFKEADIHEGIDNTLTLLEHSLDDRITIHRDYGDIPPVVCYAGQLNQVFMNLISNAGDATVGEGDIRISTRQDGDTVRIAFQDNGQGIAADHLQSIFDPFFTTKEIGKGTGLGLSISYGIVEKHGGHIDVQSAPDRGSTFTVVLPLRNETS